MPGRSCHGVSSVALSRSTASFSACQKTRIWIKQRAVQGPQRLGKC